MKKKIIAALLALSMAAVPVGCNDSSSSSGSSGSSAENSNTNDQDTDVDAEVEVSEEDNTWNVFVYLCGSDLESNYGSASLDMTEMIESDCGENVRFIVQTGGSDSWQAHDVPADKLARYEITGGGLDKIEEIDKASMGDEAQLEDFLKWGTEKYKASKNALILWDHGGGSVAGVCFDDAVKDNEGNKDSLSLNEIHTALSAVTGNDNKFELIGFDACLMSTVESAAMLSQHADFMVGSQETEPGCGWDYKAIGEFLTTSPEADGSDLGTTICDSYLSGCEEIGRGENSTLSVIDLSLIEDVQNSINEHFKQIYEKTDDMTNMVELIRNAEYAENFGGNNKNEGYTNMIDLSALITASDNLSDSGEEVRTAISNAVVYSVSGTNHADACGLSTYYPYGIYDGSSELKEFNNVAVSTYYMAFINKLIYAISTNGDMSGFDDKPFFDQSTANADLNYADNISESESQLIKFMEPPMLNEDGTYNCTLTEESLKYTKDAQGVLQLYDEESNALLLLGYSNDCIEMDWDNGYVNDKFDGTWFCLGDGQFLSVYPIERNDDFAIYTSPIKLNGAETNLRIKYDFASSQAEIVGVWDGISESGEAARDTIQLKEGDEIIPLYYVASVEDSSDNMVTVDGDKFKYDGDSTIYYQQLPDGIYLYGFSFDDIYGNSLLTDMVSYTVNGDTIGYTNLIENEDEDTEQADEE